MGMVKMENGVFWRVILLLCEGEVNQFVLDLKFFINEMRYFGVDRVFVLVWDCYFLVMYV